MDHYNEEDAETGIVIIICVGLLGFVAIALLAVLL